MLVFTLCVHNSECFFLVAREMFETCNQSSKTLILWQKNTASH